MKIIIRFFLLITFLTFCVSCSSSLKVSNHAVNHTIALKGDGHPFILEKKNN
jgi:hypothetical protein